MVNPVALGDRPEAFTGFEPVDGFLLLMVVELRFATEPAPTLDGGDAALVGAPQDTCALFFGQAGQQRQDASA